MKTPNMSLETVKGRMPKTKKGKALVAATGVATAAAVGIAASRAMRKSGTNEFRVSAAEEGWVLKSNKVGDGTHFETKTEAVDAAREIARANQPSHLIIENSDGETVREHSYEKI